MDRRQHFTSFKAVNSDVDGLREHYARTLKPTTISPFGTNKTISADDCHFSIGQFDVWAGNCQSGMEVRFREAPDAYAFYLPLKGETEFELNGTRFNSVPGTLFACDLTQVNSIRILPGRSHIGVAFCRDALIRQLNELIDAPVLKDIGLTEIIDTSSGTGAKLSSMVRLVWASLMDNPNDATTAYSNHLFIQTLMVRLLESVPHRYSASMKGLRPAPLPVHVKRAIDFMVCEIARPITIEEIASASGVSIRTLQLGFQQFKDTTPLTYLKQLRLDGVRRDLGQCCGQSELIADIAKRWGFMHLGRFASLYRDAFGETPRATITKK